MEIKLNRQVGNGYGWYIWHITVKISQKKKQTIVWVGQTMGISDRLLGKMVEVTGHWQWFSSDQQLVVDNYVNYRLVIRNDGDQWLSFWYNYNQGLGMMVLNNWSLKTVVFSERLMWWVIGHRLMVTNGDQWIVNGNKSDQGLFMGKMLMSHWLLTMTISDWLLVISYWSSGMTQISDSIIGSLGIMVNHD